MNVEFISERKKTALSKKDTAPIELYEADKMFSYEELKKQILSQCSFRKNVV